MTELVRQWHLSDEIAEAIATGATLDVKAGWSLRNLVRTAAAVADREGFYLRREILGEAEATIEAAARELGLSELRLRRVTERLKEAVRLRE